MNKKIFWIVEIFFGFIIILLIAIFFIPFNFSGSHIIDGYNITFTNRCESQKAINQQNFTICAGWANTDYFHNGFYNEFFIVSGRSIYEQYKICLHEKKHFEITNMTFEIEEEYIRNVIDNKIISDYDETCFTLMKKALKLM